MTRGTFPVENFEHIETPFYYYDLDLLKETLALLKNAMVKNNSHQHYAIKANANERILKLIAATGFGADCVSGGELQAAVKAGFPAGKIVFSGVGKTDSEINLALDLNIFCLNVESLPELAVVNDLAKKKGKTQDIALRINPNIDAHTHEFITTGLEENKFGINVADIPQALILLKQCQNLHLTGISTHIGSQILSFDCIRELCSRLKKILQFFEDTGIHLQHINVGGGLGVDYDHPELHPIAQIEQYVEEYHRHLPVKKTQTVHFELGRAVVAQCGSLISKVVFVKRSGRKKFVILDAGMTELIRPALYQAHHKIENLSSQREEQIYDIVGPICESSDCFAEDYPMSAASRGDIVAIRSAGAYGETMASQYNCRQLPKAYYSDNF